ncbi:exopolysaccharide biosynthesis protein [Parvularcula marina]|nr:exopolysaccharide biosynthesis protein [Parvularcula marina]
MQDETAGQPHYGSVTSLLMKTLDRLAHGEQPHTEKEVLGEAASGEKTDPETATKSTLGALIDAMDERAYGLLLLILALPCCLPFLYGIPQIVAVPMIAIAAQLAFGREAPWLPKGLRSRSFEIEGMRNIVRRASRYLGWVEKLAHPRLSVLTDKRGAQIVGLLLLIPCASILVPLPSTNTAPGIGVAIASVGLLERDGLLVIAGLLFGLAWVALLVIGFIFLGNEALDIIKDFILGRGEAG